jgi:primosomal protein N' (replication factor Y)
MCHYCGHSRRLPPRCPDCNGLLKFIGTGTQKVQQEIAEIFPGVETLRMDTDTVSAANSHEEILRRFEEERIPILIGTQMVTKGLNFPNVTLVGVINADNSLFAGDYRAQERTFALITQVVGRSGRAEKPGRAVIQTFSPLHEVIKAAAAQDYGAFYDAELQYRQAAQTPPFCEFYCASVSALDEQLAFLCATELKNALTAQFASAANVRVLGPSPAPVFKVNLRYRFRVIAAIPVATAEFRAAFAAVVKHIASDSHFRTTAVFGINGAD